MKFFLGGDDAEMVAIRDHLKLANVPFVDAGLGWGAKASAYSKQIAKAAQDGFTPVLVELEVDIVLPESTVVVDHHGNRAGEPASILQVLNLLKKEPTRHDQLVADNDTSNAAGLRRLGYSKSEADGVRSGEYQPSQEILDEILRALDTADAYRAAVAGELVIVRMPNSKCGPITDRLAWLWANGGEEKLLVLSGDGEANFFGNGLLCAKLAEKFGGWSGGTGLGKHDGFGCWGASAPINQSAVEAEVRAFYSAH